MDYWREKPGVGVNVVDKLLNYTILTPLSVIQWALVDNLGKGELLTHAHVYEMVASTMHKVTNRIRQIVLARNQLGLPTEQVSILDETLRKERADMGVLFGTVEDALVGIASGVADEMAESKDQDEDENALLRAWGARWLRVFRRKMAVEEAWVGESLGVAEETEVAEGVGDGEDEQGGGSLNHDVEDEIQ
jgi:nuclear cap-binding protein subunit 1